MPIPNWLMEHAITVEYLTSSKDAGGGTVLGYATRAAQKPALVNTASSSTQTMYAKDQITCTHTIATEYHGVRSGDRIRAYDAYGSFVGYFAVVGLRTQPGVPFVDIGDVTYIDCRQVTEGDEAWPS